MNTYVMMVEKCNNNSTSIQYHKIYKRKLNHIWLKTEKKIMITIYILVHLSTIKIFTIPHKTCILRKKTLLFFISRYLIKDSILKRRYLPISNDIVLPNFLKTLPFEPECGYSVWWKVTLLWRNIVSVACSCESTCSIVMSHS